MDPKYAPTLKTCYNSDLSATSVENATGCLI